MITVSELISALQKYPEDAMCYAYEGESIGIVVVDKEIGVELGFIPCREIWQYSDTANGATKPHKPKHEKESTRPYTPFIDELQASDPTRRLEFIAISKLDNPEDIRRFYKEYRKWIVHLLPKEIEGGRSVESLVSTNLGYVIGYLNDPERRQMWYDTIGDLHPIFKRC